MRPFRRRWRARGERGFVAIELAAGAALLVLPVAMRCSSSSTSAALMFSPPRMMMSFLRSVIV